MLSSIQSNQFIISILKRKWKIKMKYSKCLLEYIELIMIEYYGRNTIFMRINAITIINITFSI